MLPVNSILIYIKITDCRYAVHIVASNKRINRTYNNELNQVTCTYFSNNYQEGVALLTYGGTMKEVLSNNFKEMEFAASDLCILILLKL